MARRANEQTEGAQFVRYFGPLLDALRKLGGSGAPREVVEQIARDLDVPDEVQSELMDSGAPRFPNQVAWARFYLTREGLLDKSRRGVWSLTDRGRESHLTPADAREIFLKWVKVFRDEREKKKAEVEPSLTESAAPGAHESAAQGHREELLRLLLDPRFYR